MTSFLEVPISAATLAEPPKKREAVREDAINPQTKAPLPDRDVLNLRLDYEPNGGALEGLRVQIYYSDERLIGASEPRDQQTQFRAEVNYVVPLM